MDAKNAAQDASRAKSRFLSMMSHELRTPLNAIIGFSDVLRLELFGPRDLPVYQDYADNIHRSGRHLLDLVNQILDVSRVEAGKLDLKMENLPLPAALTDVLQMEGGAILKKSLRVHRGGRPGAARSAPTASRCASCCSTWSTTPSSIRRPAAPSRSTPGRPTAA